MTIKDISKQAGVSTATVSYVINGTRSVSPETRQLVLDVIAKTDFQPNRAAKSLRTKKTNIIGVLVEDILPFPTTQIINGISEYIEQTDYSLLLNDLRLLKVLFNQYDQIIHQKDKINKALSLLCFGANVDAVIYVGMFDRDNSDIIDGIGKPIVMAYSTSQNKNVSSVTYENENMAFELARHLFDNGHKEIAVITGLAHTAPAQLRLNGIHRAFEKSGLTLDSRLIKYGSWERNSGYSCMTELLQQRNGNLPTAVLAMNDLMAIGAMEAIRDAGLRIPEDISVVGFDNREVSDFVSPALTTVDIDLERIGYTSAEMIVHKLNGKGDLADEKNIVLPGKLIIRDSVKRLI